MILLILKTGTVLNNIYRVVRLLGKGSMGNVYLAERIKDDKKFVVKELMFSKEASLNPEDAKEIFFREAEFMAKFDHPGIPKIYGVFSQDKRDYLAMDYIEGKTLEEVISSSEGPVDTYLAVKWTASLCKILYYLHNCFKAPIVYRDLKPSNIIITSEDEVKLVDFGIARYYNPDKNTDTFSYGSPGYAAPEQYKGRGQSSPQTDVFALGVILFQMLTKYDPTLKPFTFPSMRDKNPSVSEELERVVKRAIELDHMKRYISIDEFRENLEKVVGRPFSQEGTSSSGYSKSYKPPAEKPGKLAFITSAVGYLMPFIGLWAPTFLISSFNLPLDVGFVFQIVFALFIAWSISMIYLIVRRRPFPGTVTGMVAFWVIFGLPWMCLGTGHIAYTQTRLLAACESNMKNLATALEIYATDYDGDYPTTLDKLLEPAYVYVINDKTIQKLEGRLEKSQLDTLSSLKNEKLTAYTLYYKLPRKEFSPDEFEQILSCSEKMTGAPYMKKIPPCPISNTSYVYLSSQSPDNFTLCCGKTRTAC